MAEYTCESHSGGSSSCGSSVPHTIGQFGFFFAMNVLQEFFLHLALSSMDSLSPCQKKASGGDRLLLRWVTTLHHFFLLDRFGYPNNS